MMKVKIKSHFFNFNFITFGKNRRINYYKIGKFKTILPFKKALKRKKK